MALAEHTSIPNMTVLMCSNCTGAPNSHGFATELTEYTTANREQAAIFNDILRDTMNPALALQAHFTNLLTMSYYDHQVLYDLREDVAVVRDVTVIYPVGRKSFIIVFILSMLHLTVVGFVTVLFYLRTKHVLLGNSWSPIAQLWSPESDVWLKWQTAWRITL